jgi:hypothetical protein
MRLLSRGYAETKWSSPGDTAELEAAIIKGAARRRLVA